MDAKELLQTLVSLVAVGGFLFGVLQYQQAQRWRRLEYAANQLQRLQSDADLVLATTFLDFSKRRVPLPERYWDYAGQRVFQHDCQTLYRVMALRYEDTPEFFIYVEVFERLFGYLAQIYEFLDMRLLKASDVKALTWILTNLAQPQWTTDRRIFIGCLSLDFDNVLRLMDVFKIEHAAKMAAAQVEELAQDYNLRRPPA